MTGAHQGTGGRCASDVSQRNLTHFEAAGGGGQVASATGSRSAFTLSARYRGSPEGVIASTAPRNLDDEIPSSPDDPRIRNEEEPLVGAFTKHPDWR